MRTPAVRWPEDGTWWSKSFPCGLRGVTTPVIVAVVHYGKTTERRVVVVVHTYPARWFPARSSSPAAPPLAPATLGSWRRRRLVGWRWRCARQVTHQACKKTKTLANACVTTYPRRDGACRKGPRRSQPRWQSSGWWAATCLGACRAESAEGRRVNTKVSVSTTDRNTVLF